MERRIFINLATLRRGGGLVHVSSFLPELVSQAACHIAAVVPAALQQWAEDLGIEVTTHDYPAGDPRLRLIDQWVARSAARSADVMLSPMNHGTIAPQCPHILWACNVLHFDRAGGVVRRTNDALARRAMRHADLVIFPSESARSEASTAGVQVKSSTVMLHPVRDHETGWRQSEGDGVLRVLVPSSSQPHKNLDLLPRVSRELAARGVAHQFHVTAQPPYIHSEPYISSIERYEPSDFPRVAKWYDACLLPTLRESYSYSLVEAEGAGIPLAASAIPVHVELARAAELFDANSASGAADALLAATRRGGHQRAISAAGSPTHSTPKGYASSVLEACDELATARREER